MKIIYIIVLMAGLSSILAFSAKEGRKVSHTNDFRQYYGAALVARSGDWSLLYPDPIPGGTRNAGGDAVPKPGYSKLAEAAGIVGPQNFIQPPVVALLLTPLAYFDYSKAEWVWRLVATLSVAGIAVISGRIARYCVGASSPVLSEIVTIALICLLPNRTITPLNVAANVSPIVGLMIAIGVLSVLRKDSVGSVAGIGVAGILKISPAILLIPACVRWRSDGFVKMAGVGVVLLASTLALTGVGPWVIFATKIAPTLGRPWLPSGDDHVSTISVYGLAYLVTHQNPLPRAIEASFGILSFAGTVILIGICVHKRRAIATDIRASIASLACMIAWPLVIAPLSWGHYSYYHLVLNGWLVTECGRRLKVRALIPGTILFLTFGPWGKIPPFSTSTLLASFVPLIISMMILVFSLVILCTSGECSQPASRPNE